MTARSQLRDRLLHLASGHMISKAMYCAAELGVADELTEGPKDAGELARQLQCSPDHLRRLLLALASIGIFRYEGGKFRQTPLSEYLRRDCPETIWPVVEFFGNEMYKAADALLVTIQTGRRCWDEVFEVPVWAYLSRNRDRGGVFDAVMSATSSEDLKAILEAYDFSDAELIVDVGGGDGFVLTGILERYPRAKGVLFDLAPVVERAAAARGSNPAAARCDFVGGDFFDRVPAGGDVQVLRRILHDWGDADAVRILHTCRSALRNGGKLLLIEQVLSETHHDQRAAWSDVGMMAFGGRERTTSQYEDLLSASGFALEGAIDTSSGARILVGVPRAL